MNLDLTRPLEYDGKPARLIATDVKGDHPIVVAVPSADGRYEYVIMCRLDGTHLSGELGPVYNTPAKIVRYAALGPLIYPGSPVVETYANLHTASAANPNRTIVRLEETARYTS